jgi:glycosyltransferase involved in cell wall biosynthesis
MNIFRKVSRIKQKLWGTLIYKPTELNYKLLHYQKKHKSANLDPRPEDFISRIEVIIPCYNHGSYLRECFQSILDQTWKKMPVTVTFMDDNSTDDTPAIIGEIVRANSQNKDIIIRHIKNTSNFRQSKSINKAISTSNNQLFIILNDDDVLTKDALDKIVRTLTANPDLYLLGASSIWFEEIPPPHKVMPTGKLKLTKYGPSDTVGITSLNDINMTHSSQAFFKCAWEAVGGYRDKLSRLTGDINEDRDFQLRVAALMPIGVYKDYPLAFWRTDTSHGKEF